MASKTMRANVIIGGSMSGAFRSALSSTKNGMKAIGDEIAKVERKQRLMSRSIESFGRLGRNVDGMRRQYAELAREADILRKAQSRLADVNGRIDRNTARRQQLGGAMRGAAATFGATAAAVFLPTRQAAAFNRQNQLIGNTANMTRSEVAELGRTILATSRDTNQSASDVQRGIGFLVAAGLDARRAQASIITIGRTATAAGADIEDLSNASFTLIDALKIKPEGLQDALDILAVAGKQGNVELRDMAKALPALGSSFAALKMEGRDAAATLGAALEIARKGAGNADEAANNMRNFMAKILAPDTLKKAQKKFGLDLYGVIQQAQRNGGNPFEAAMQSIMKATSGDQKKIGELFQDMQVQNFLRPMIQNWDEYTRIKSEALNGSAGTTDRDFALMMASAGEQMRGLRNSAVRLGISFGTVMSPSIGDAASKMAHFLDTASGFIEKNSAVVKGIVGAALAFTGLRVVTLGAAYALTVLKTPILSVMGFIAKWRATGALAAMGRFGPVAMKVAKAARMIGTAMAAIGGGPIALAVGALTVGALVVRKYWQPIGAWIGGAMRGIGESVAPVFAQLGAALAPLKPAWDAVSTAIGSAWSWVVRLLEPVNMTSAELAAAGESGRSFGRILGAVMSSGVKVITAVVKAVAWVGQAIGTAAGFLVVNFSKAWDKVKSIVGAAVAWILRKVQPILSVGSTIGNAVVGAARWLGFTGDQPAAPGARGPAATMPKLAPARGRRAPRVAAAPSPANKQTSVEQTNHFTIVQQPGESSETLARRVASHMRHQAAIDRRSSVLDSVW